MGYRIPPGRENNIKSFGAVGDGTTDDYSAISAAITAIGSDETTLIFPPGTYLTETPITFNANTTLLLEPGAQLTDGATASVVITVNGDLRPIGKTAAEAFDVTGAGSSVVLADPTIKFGQDGLKYGKVQFCSVSAVDTVGTDDATIEAFGAGRLRINTPNSSAYVEVLTDEGMLIRREGAASTAPGGFLKIIDDEASSPTVMQVQQENISFTNTMATLECAKAANSDYNFLECISDFDGTPDTEIKLSGDGNGTCDGSWTGGGADYAECFEWEDANSNDEDRVGMTISLVGAKIKIAEEGDTIIGVISGDPSFIGNNHSGSRDKYLTDDFGRFILDAEGFRTLNPDWEETEENGVPLSKRQSWGVVGLVGRLRVRKDQVTPNSWIKLADISDNVVEYLVK